MSIADRVDNLTDEQLQALPDSGLQELTESSILDEAIMQRFPRFAAKTYERADRIYDECVRRSRGIYQRAYNAAVLSQGHRKLVRPVDNAGA